MSEVKLTEAQWVTLSVLAKKDCRTETNSLSVACGHRYTAWAYGKLVALEKLALVKRYPGDRCSLTSWVITPLGRSALAPELKEANRGEG